MPIFNWNKYRDTQKGKYLIKDVFKKNKIQKAFFHLYYGVLFAINPNSFDINFYQDAWNNLYQQYVDKFGFEEDFKTVIDLMNDRFNLQQKWFNQSPGKKDMFLITEINALTAEIEEIQKTNPNTEDVDFESVKVFVDKWIGSFLNPKECSVVQYRYYLNKMSEPQKNQVSEDVSD